MNFSTDVTKDLYNFPLEKADKPQVKINEFTLTPKKSSQISRLQLAPGSAIQKNTKKLPGTKNLALR